MNTSRHPIVSSHREKNMRKIILTANLFIIIKADAGTYGMAVMTVRSVEEAQSLNRKQRTSMSKSKGGQPVHTRYYPGGVFTHRILGVKKMQSLNR